MALWKEHGEKRMHDSCILLLLLGMFMVTLRDGDGEMHQKSMFLLNRCTFLKTKHFHSSELNVYVLPLHWQWEQLSPHSLLSIFGAEAFNGMLQEPSVGVSSTGEKAGAGTVIWINRCLCFIPKVPVSVLNGCSWRQNKMISYKEVKCERVKI